MCFLINKSVIKEKESMKNTVCLKNNVPITNDHTFIVKNDKKEHFKHNTEGS